MGLSTTRVISWGPASQAAPSPLLALLLLGAAALAQDPSAAGDTGAIIGVAFGAVIMLAVVAGAGVCVWKCCLRRRCSRQPAEVAA